MYLTSCAFFFFFLNKFVEPFAVRAILLSQEDHLHCFHLRYYLCRHISLKQHKSILSLLLYVRDNVFFLSCSVIKIVLQFCKENSLHQTFQTLQNECQVSLNTVDSLETFIADINSGRWDAVLPQVAQLKLPRKILEDLYEQVCMDHSFKEAF